MRGQPGHAGQSGTSPYESSVSSMYHSPMAAMLATSPEFHAQAHAAAMAALQVALFSLHPPCRHGHCMRFDNPDIQLLTTLLMSQQQPWPRCRWHIQPVLCIS